MHPILRPYGEGLGYGAYWEDLGENWARLTALHCIRIPHRRQQRILLPDSKVHEANMGPIWGRQDPGGPHVGPRNFATRDCIWINRGYQGVINIINNLFNVIHNILRYILLLGYCWYISEYKQFEKIPFLTNRSHAWGRFVTSVG